jgi:hypothetical protein
MRTKTQVQKQQERQLYTLVPKLASHIEDKDELGAILAYSVVQSLINFQTMTGSEEERMFQEVKRIYAGLEQTIQECSQQSSFMKLCNFQSELNPLLKHLIINNLQETGDSQIFNLIASYLSNKKGNYEDMLRRNGLLIIDKIYSRGSLYGTRNILTQDYLVIRDGFV